MTIRMKLALGVALTAIIGMVAFSIRNMNRETVLFVYPIEALRRELHITCIEPYNGRPAQENADLAFMAFEEGRAQNPSSAEPSFENFAEVARSAARTAEETIEFIENEFGCYLEMI